ncbi:hypothetical protein WICMUC_004190 [Wickerhamomyces mucosus]|uniref:Uncharacterized protein n=1 Tax=Wickerhamomyces mucosus TaxID=1378264 RepID=A0A9P8PJX6_9ASCO|nr:hypothetical protein WICMUC_004190 [Wickerhamomyces mucosus]
MNSISLSRSPSRSPSRSLSKSPKRLALSSKDSNNRINIIQKLDNSSIKSLNSTPKLSPIKQNLITTRSSSSSSSSPIKQISPIKKKNSSININQTLQFKIFEDSNDYSNEFNFNNIIDENEFIKDKENHIPIEQIQNNNNGRNRLPLTNLNILKYSGEIIYFSNPMDSFKLDQYWCKDYKINIPNFITPSRKDRNRYISLSKDIDYYGKGFKKRSNSESQLNYDHIVKKLDFNIYKDSS